MKDKIFILGEVFAICFLLTVCYLTQGEIDSYKIDCRMNYTAESVCPCEAFTRLNISSTDSPFKVNLSDVPMGRG